MFFLFGEFVLSPIKRGEFSAKRHEVDLIAESVDRADVVGFEAAKIFQRPYSITVGLFSCGIFGAYGNREWNS